MAFFLDKQEMAQRFGNPTSEFRSFFDTNHIRHGSPEDLFEFAKTLENSNQFRMELSALVKSVTKREKDELLLTDMVSIIAVAVGGQSIADTHADIIGPTNKLMEFLLGTGCWRQFGSPSRPVSQSPSPSSEPLISVEETSPVRSSLPVSPTSTASKSPEDRAILLDISTELRQTLSRLESNTQQVKLHLDSIDRRITKIAPSADVPLAQGSAGVEPLLHRGIAGAAPPDVARPAAEGIPAAEPEPPTRGRAVFSHSSQLGKSQMEGDDFSSPIFAYGTQKGRSMAPFAIFLALVAVGAAVFLFLHFEHGDALIKAGISRFKANHPSLNVAAPASSAPPSPAPIPTSPAPGSASSSAPTQLPSEASNDVAGVTPTNSLPPDGVNPNASPDGTPVADSPKIRYIQANVMEGRLLSAPRPQYPSQARLDHVEGQVALQATISKTGSVETLHVINGPRPLRAAAVDGVRNWRYTPYSVDGKAVKVATTVYVDFNLRPPPAIVH